MLLDYFARPSFALRLSIKILLNQRLRESITVIRFVFKNHNVRALHNLVRRSVKIKVSNGSHSRLLAEQ